MEAFDWKPERLLLMRFQLQDIAKRIVKPKVEETQQNTQRPINFVKGGVIGCGGSHNKEVKATGDSYFNKISEQFRRQGGEESVQIDDQDGRQENEFDLVDNEASGESSEP